MAAEQGRTARSDGKRNTTPTTQQRRTATNATTNPMTLPSVSTTAVAAAVAIMFVTADAVPQPALRRTLQSNQRDARFESSVGSPIAGGGTLVEFGKYVQPSVIQMGASVAGHSTYHLTLTPVGKAEAVYAIFGHQEVPLRIPPAFQVANPFGTDTAGTPSDLWAYSPDSQFDSYLFGTDVGLLTNRFAGSIGAASVGTVGIPFSSWSAATGLSSNNGAVFYMDPTEAPAGSMLVAQLTVPVGTGFTAQIGAQGHLAIDPVWQATLDIALMEANGEDPSKARESWSEESLTFSVAASGQATPAVLGESERPTGH